MPDTTITRIRGRRVWDSRGRPTVEAEIHLAGGASRQEDIDAKLIGLDGTPNKARLGANATVAVSLAALHAAARAHGLPLFRYLAQGKPVRLPLPEIQIFGGGAHAGRRIDIQDLMVIALAAQS